MMDRRVAIVAVAVIAVAALFFVLRPEGDEEATRTETSTVATTRTEEPAPTTTAGTTTQIAVAWRIDTRDERLDRLRVPVDARVVITVVADTSDHVHLHGYDLMADVEAGSPARLQFDATITGRFEIELEDAGQEIAQLTVVP